MATLTVDEAEYMALIEYYTEKAIERVDRDVDHNLDPDVLSEEAPEIINSTVSHTEIESNHENDIPPYLYDESVTGWRNAVNHHSMVYFASLLDADASLFTNTDGRKLDCEAWRTEWEWFADDDRFNHTKEKQSGPVTHDYDWNIPLNPFKIVESVARGVFTARVYDRVADHFGERIEAAESDESDDEVAA